MNPTDNINNQTGENSLPTLPNLDLTIAPKDDLLVLPQDQTIKTEQLPTQETSNNQPLDFSPPSGWGKTSVDITDKISIPEYPENEDNKQKEKKESGLVKFVKVFLIAIALILLGVLLGVLATNFLGGTNVTGNNQGFEAMPGNSDPSDIISSSSGETANQMTDLTYSNKLEYRNNGEGPYSFDLMLTSDWKIASNSTEKNNLNIALTNQDLFVKLVYNTTQDATKTSLCLLPEEVTPKNMSHIKYFQVEDFGVNSFSWKLVKNLMATESASYLVCEQNSNNQYVNLTSVGYINAGLSSGNEIDTTQKNLILKLFEGLSVINSTPSSDLNTKQSEYACPENGWISCMPVLSEEGKKNCSGDAISWYKKNCSNFQGVAM